MRYFLVFMLLIAIVHAACLDTPSSTVETIQQSETDSLNRENIETKDVSVEVLDLTNEVNLYIVVAGAYSTEDGATKKAQELKDLGYPNADVIQREGSQLFSTVVERFDNQADAEVFANKLLINDEIKAYVYKLK